MKITANDISLARNAMEDNDIRIIREGKYESVFNGYIASFGASLVQAGLLPTIIFFAKEDSEAKERPLVIKALKKMMGIDKNTSMAMYVLNKDEGSSLRRCDDKAFVQKVVRCMTAMKLALRMYEKIKNDDNEPR